MPSGKTLCYYMLLCLSIGQANAMTVETYNKLQKSNPQQLQMYLEGVGAGYGWSNAYLGTSKDTHEMYCEPDKLALNGDNFKNILEAEIKRSYHPSTEKEKSKSHIELLLLRGLINTFPC